MWLLFCLSCAGLQARQNQTRKQIKQDTFQWMRTFPMRPNASNFEVARLIRHGMLVEQRLYWSGEDIPEALLAANDLAAVGDQGPFASILAMSSRSHTLVHPATIVCLCCILGCRPFCCVKRSRTRVQNEFDQLRGFSRLSRSCILMPGILSQVKTMSSPRVYCAHHTKPKLATQK
jgi:hypothetical protein